MNDLYETLQCHPSADPEVIEAAYKRLAAKYHPDRSTGSDSESRFKAVCEAYKVLGDSKRRRDYDERNGHAEPQTTKAAESITFRRGERLPQLLDQLGFTWKMSFKDAKFLLLSNGWSISGEKWKREVAPDGSIEGKVIGGLLDGRGLNVLFDIADHGKHQEKGQFEARCPQAVAKLWFDCWTRKDGQAASGSLQRISFTFLSAEQ